MNKPLLLIAALACFATAHSQFPYSATVLNEYYLPLDNPTSLGIEVGWDDPEVQIPLDFSIDLDGNNSGGILILGGTGEMLMNTTENGTCVVRDRPKGKFIDLDDFAKTRCFQKAIWQY